jgi:peptidoglycan/xylan/chitin deacetylase (PgdA/CDA1 family)
MGRNFPRNYRQVRGGRSLVIPEGMALRVALAAAAVVIVVLPASSRTTALAASQPTIVSLTFDDGRATEYAARSLLAARGMKATFYINSSKLGTDSDYMTWAQVDGLAADGNEIGGHTAFHVDMTRTDSTEAQREVCNDRVNLLNRGYQVRNFAYPFGAYNASAQTIVRNCG